MKLRGGGEKNSVESKKAVQLDGMPRPIQKKKFLHGKKGRGLS